MNVFITGGMGFVGRRLSEALVQDGHRVTAVGRSRKPSNPIENPAFRYQSVDTTIPGEWQKRLPEYDAVINLAGKSIFTLWTEKAKQQILESRVKTTRNLVEGLNGRTTTLLISTSAVGYYGDRGEKTLTESDAPGDDFLARVGQAWEAEALKAKGPNLRVVLTRFGIVLGKGGGAMATMMPPFRMFLGGRLGSGQQWFPWVHLGDLVDIFRFIISNENLSGPVNCCAPQPIRNKDLAKTLGGKLHRPALMPAPAFMIRGVLGEFGAALLNSQRVKPAALERAGFIFTYPDIDSALTEIVAS